MARIRAGTDPTSPGRTHREGSQSGHAPGVARISRTREGVDGGGAQGAHGSTQAGGLLGPVAVDAAPVSTPPVKESPAPVVSMVSTLKAGMWPTKSSWFTHAPLGSVGDDGEADAQLAQPLGGARPGRPCR